MKISKQTIRKMTVALAAGCFAYVSSASVTYQINNGGLESFNMTIDGSSRSGLAGGILINKVGGDASIPTSYVTLCSDIGGTLYLGQSYEYETPVIPFSGQSGLSPKWGDGTSDGSAAKAIQNAAYLFYTHGNLSGTGIGLSSTTQKAALQLAVWGALYNTVADGSVSGGRFNVNGGDQAAIDQANLWLSSLSGNYVYNGYLLYPLQGSSVNADGRPPQELLMAVPVPEASTVVAGLLLLLPLGASALKIIRKTDD